MKAVAYARVSTDHSDQKNSITAQIAYFEEQFEKGEYERADCGLYYRRVERGSRNFTSDPLKGFYVDEGISGTSLKNRHAFNQMIEDAMNGKFEMILTKSVSRFSRSVEDGVKVYKDLRQRGVGIFFLNENLNSLNITDESFIIFHLGFAQDESVRKSISVQFGIRKAQKEGKWISTTPYGYFKQDGKLFVKEDEAEVIRNIFNLYYNEGFGTGKIARYLNNQDISTQKNALWTQTQVCSILENPLYKGIQITHAYQSDDITRHTQRQVPSDERIVMQLDRVKIVDESLFDLVQGERQRRRDMRASDSDQAPDPTVKSHRYSNQHIFSNLLFCGNCGSALKRKKRNSRNPDGTRKDLGYEWACRMNDMYGKKRCAYRNAYPEEALMDYVRQEVKDYIENGLGRDVSLENYLYTYYNTEEVETRLRDVEEKIQTVNEDIEHAYLLHKKRMIDDEQFLERNQRLQVELRKLRADKAELSIVNQRIEQTKEKYIEFTNEIETLDPDNLTNRALSKVISRIKVQTLPSYMERTVGDLKPILIEWAFLDKTEMQIIYDMADLDMLKMKREWNSDDEDPEAFDNDDLPFPE